MKTVKVIALASMVAAVPVGILLKRGSEGRNRIHNPLVTEASPTQGEAGFAEGENSPTAKSKERETIKPEDGPLIEMISEIRRLIKEDPEAALARISAELKSGALPQANADALLLGMTGVPDQSDAIRAGAFALMGYGSAQSAMANSFLKSLCDRGKFDEAKNFYTTLPPGEFRQHAAEILVKDFTKAGDLQALLEYSNSLKAPSLSKEWGSGIIPALKEMGVLDDPKKTVECLGVLSNKSARDAAANRMLWRDAPLDTAVEVGKFLIDGGAETDLSASDLMAGLRISVMRESSVSEEQASEIVALLNQYEAGFKSKEDIVEGLLAKQQSADKMLAISLGISDPKLQLKAFDEIANSTLIGEGDVERLSQGIGDPELRKSFIRIVGAKVASAGAK